MKDISLVGDCVLKLDLILRSCHFIVITIHVT